MKDLHPLVSEIEARERRRAKKPKKIKKQPHHDIFLMSPELAQEYNGKLHKITVLDQIVNVYEHNRKDFERNAFRIIDHFRKHLGKSSGRIYTIGQFIKFRVKKDGEIYSMSLFQFFHNYLLLEPIILFHANVDEWTPWTPIQFSNSAWAKQIDDISYICRPYCTADQFGEIIADIKYAMNMFAVRVGDILGLSISNNEIIELEKRSKEARETIECKNIPDDLEPNQLEKLVAKRTTNLLNFMGNQYDLSLSVYARNGLFNPMQAREFFTHIGYKPTLTGSTLPYTENTNALMGWKGVLSQMSNSIGGRKAETIKLKVSDAGDFERSISALLSNIRWVDMEYDCDSPHFRKRVIDSQEVLNNLEGRVCKLDPDSDEYYIIDPRDPTQKLIGKTVWMKTPITCTHPDRAKGVICSACYGKLLASTNQKYHIGRLSALNDADEMEQKLLSAKHALLTNTSKIAFSENFNEYFENDYCRIRFSGTFIDEVLSDPDTYKNLYFEFNLSTIKKNKDGENRNFDRSITEIVIYNAKTEDRVVVSEENQLPIFFSPLFNDQYFLPAAKRATDDIVLVSIADIIQNECDHIPDNEASFLLFEYQYKNYEIADSLMQINNILYNGTTISQYTDFNTCLDEMLPLFHKGGIKIPEIHIEMLISALIFSPDAKPVDWTEKNPEYTFYSITKAILNGPSIVNALLYREVNHLISGRYNAYEKTGTSVSDVFLSEKS